MKSFMCALAAGSALMASAASFKDGERVVFCGDSVTHHGYYVTPIQTFYYTRFPDRNVQIFNCGVGGESANETPWRFEKDVVEKRPTTVHVLLGMNDVGVLGYYTNASPESVAHAKSAPVRFEKSMRELKGLFDAKLPKAGLIWATLVPWDDELKFAKPRMPITGVTAAEAPLSETVRNFHRQYGGGFVDYYTEMLAYNRKLHQRDPYASLSPDTIHPKEPGGLFMMRLFLKAHGEEGLVSKTVVDAKEAQTLTADNAAVSDLRVSGNGVTFKLLEKALPFPVEPNARAIADELGFDDELNREMLCVKGLAAGDWKLKIDGREICRASAAEWAEGINLAKYETPMMEHARKVAALTAGRRDQEKEIRSMWVAHMVARRWLFGFGLTNEDFSDIRYMQAYARGYVKGDAGRKAGDTRMFQGFLDNWPKRAALEAAVEKAHENIRQANRPVAHAFELTK